MFEAIAVVLVRISPEEFLTSCINVNYYIWLAWNTILHKGCLFSSIDCSKECLIFKRMCILTHDY